MSVIQQAKNTSRSIGALSRNRIVSFGNRVREIYRKGRLLFKGERLAQAGIVVLVFYLFLAIFGRTLAPYGPTEINRDAQGGVLRSAPPSLDHPLGTTNLGRDVLTQLMYGAQTSFIVGLSAALIAIFIGVNIGLISGYYGGWIDNALMRFTDLAFGFPFLPFAIVFLFLFGPSTTGIILVIGLVMWRSTSRVIRSEVLSHRERAYVESAKLIGASNVRIMYRHILPNLIPLIALYLAFSVAWAIIFEATLSFLGFGDPRAISWGRMLNQAYHTGSIRFAWWWTVPPGVAITLMIMSVFVIGRVFEKVANPDIRHR